MLVSVVSLCFFSGVFFRVCASHWLHVTSLFSVCVIVREKKPIWFLSFCRLLTASRILSAEQHSSYTNRTDSEKTVYGRRAWTFESQGKQKCDDTITRKSSSIGLKFNQHRNNCWFFCFPRPLRAFFGLWFICVRVWWWAAFCSFFFLRSILGTWAPNRKWELDCVWHMYTFRAKCLRTIVIWRESFSIGRVFHGCGIKLGIFFHGCRWSLALPVVFAYIEVALTNFKSCDSQVLSTFDFWLNLREIVPFTSCDP